MHCTFPKDGTVRSKFKRLDGSTSVFLFLFVSIGFILTGSIKTADAALKDEQLHPQTELGFIQNCAALPTFGSSQALPVNVSLVTENTAKIENVSLSLSGNETSSASDERHNYNTGNSGFKDWTWNPKHLLNAGRRTSWFEVKCSQRFREQSDNGTKGDKVKLCTKTGLSGELLVRDWSWKWAAVPESMYCIVQKPELAEEERDQETKFTSHEDVLGSICSEYFDKPKEIWANVTTIRVALGILVSITSLFFIFILVVLVNQWNKQGLPGWLTMSLVITMFLLHLIKGPEHIWGTTSNSQTESPSLLCTIVGISIHFLHLSSFCWMTVLSFDIWWTFRSLSLKAKQSRNIARFLMYVTFAFGVPGVIVGVGLFLESFYGEGDCGLIITPRYGSGICYLQPPALAPYLMYPVALLVASNICFFCSTAYNLKQHRKSSAMARENISKNSEQLALYWKLFFTMGIPWTCAMISALFNLGAIWTIGMILCILQPVSIFVIFMCTSEMRKTMKTTLEKWKK